ncbi:unnamed protein product [Lathyrus oleraceus]|uniref:Uncharacterized protein n=1 Tax=Pisum sativum TaxID=3888 RepID=A0A9D4YL05_PEA|nr:hypothetical protein KIW84_024784 [Pisum sativum]
MRFAGALRNILRPLSLSSSTPLTSQISTTLPFHAPFPSYSKPPQFLLPFLNHFHTLTDTRFPKRRPSDKPRRKRASLRPSGPYAWVEHTTGETILPNKPNEGSVKRRNEKKRMRQRRAFILVSSPFTCYYIHNESWTVFEYRLSFLLVVKQNKKFDRRGDCLLLVDCMRNA